MAEVRASAFLKGRSGLPLSQLDLRIPIDHKRSRTNKKEGGELCQKRKAQYCKIASFKTSSRIVVMRFASFA
jgi:hypothetical protein